MYHYVTEYNEMFPNLRFLNFNNFVKQLDYFESRYGFITFDEWEDFIFNGKSPEKKGKIILTFDDALSCHYDYVFKELNKRNLWGLFYIPTNPYTIGNMLFVHKIHLLCSKVSGKDLNLYTKKIITEDMIPDKKKDEFIKKTYVNQNNYYGITEFKRLLNYFLDYNFREEIIQKIGEHFSINYNVNKFYLSVSQIKEMEKEGMIIGSHTASHLVMSKLNYTDQKSEIKLSFEFLESISKPKHRTYCHPFGGFHSFDKQTLSILKENNVDYSFNVESKEINNLDISINKQMLPRFDCNEFKFGKAS